MKLAEKIKYLRNMKNISQEELAEKCQVSRQSVSKWELDITLPETEKLLQLSRSLGVSLDVLLKDELVVDGIIETESCSLSHISEESGIYEGVLIKEGIENEDILDSIDVNKIELWKTKNYPRYWTVLTFSSKVIDLPDRLSKVLISDECLGGNWFVDLKRGNIKYIVFRDKVLSYTIGNQIEKDTVIKECRRFGISDEEMKWKE